MQVHHRWLKLALVAAVVIHAVAGVKVYNMRSNLDGSESADTTDSSSELVIERTPTPTARAAPRTWIPITDAPSDSSTPSDSSGTETPRKTTATPRVTTKAPRTKTPSPTTKTPRATTKTPRATTSSSSESSSTYEGTLDSEGASDSGQLEDSTVASADSGSEEETASTDGSGSTKKTTKKKAVFTKSPYLEQTTPVPNGIPTANDDNSGESASASASPADSASKSEESGSSSKSKPKTTKSKTKKKSTDSASGSDSSSSAASRPNSKKSSSSTKQNSSSKTSDTAQSATPSPADSTTSASSSTTSASASAASSSAASVMTDSASSGKAGLSSTLTLVLIMGGVVALVMVIAVFIYIRTAEKDEEEDDMDPVLRTARHDGNKGTAQSSTMAANYHGNDNMSPMEYSDDEYYPNHHQDGQYDQDPYGHHGHHGNSGGASVNYNDPNLDMLTPQSQIALAHSQMSLPPMAQTGQTNASSQFSNFTAQSSFYANSAYSANPSSVSQVVSKYPGMRKGKEENDVAGSEEEEESDFEGDSIQDMSHATNQWNSAGRNRASTGASTAMDRSMVESRFEPGDSRSTAASGRSTGFNGKNTFMQSEYTEYRMSNEYENSYANGQSGYDNSFASGKSGYDSNYAGGKSFQSSGFSEYERHGPGRDRGNSGNSDASSFYRSKKSRFTDASYC